MRGKSAARVVVPGYTAGRGGRRATGRIGTERFSRGNQLQSCNDISGSAALVGASRDREILALCEYSYRSELLQLDIHFFSRILHICQRRMKSGSSATWVEENG